MGGYGSGKSRDATEAVERLLAAILRDDRSSVSHEVGELDIAHRTGASKMSGRKILVLLQRASESLAFDAVDAEAQPKDHLGDVKVTLRSGEARWIEVKAQTKKEKFGQIVEADYVRDGTDFLRRFDSVSEEFNTRMNPELRLALELDRPMASLHSWTLEELWTADLALLDTETKKKQAKVSEASDLHTFLERKYILHLCMNGVRYVRLDNLGPIKEMAGGATIRWNIKSNSGSTAAVQVSAGREPSHSTTDFTYHVGFKNSNAAGRHKMHDVAWRTSVNVKQFEA